MAPVVYGGKVRAVMAYLDPREAAGPQSVAGRRDERRSTIPTCSCRLATPSSAIRTTPSTPTRCTTWSSGWATSRCATEHGNATYLRDVATPKDANFIQTNIVRVNGRRQVYMPVYRQLGSQHADVVANVKKSLPDMQRGSAAPDIDLKLVMDQSVYVRTSIAKPDPGRRAGRRALLARDSAFLGRVADDADRHYARFPISVMAAIIGLYYTAAITINVMTLAGLALAIGPLVDSAIICLENTHRHLGLGRNAERGRVSRGQRSGHARAGRQLLHAAGAGPAGARCPAWASFCFVRWPWPWRLP